MSPGAGERVYGIAPPGFRLPDQTHVGRVRLQVSDLARSVAYYRDILRLRLTSDDSTTARFAVDGGSDLVELHHDRGTRPVPRGGVLGLVIGVVAVLLATYALVADFTMIEELSDQGAPAIMAWRGAFGLTMTLIWLYTEILRILAILRGDD